MELLLIININMNKIEICPIDSKVCDRTCGFKVHFNLTRKEQPKVSNVCAKYAEDCDFRCGFDVHMSKDTTETNPNLCVSCEG